MVVAFQDAGFEVLAAAGGAEALDKLVTSAGTVRGLVTDVNLGPGPDGWEVAQRARELSSALPVVYVTGRGMNEWSSKGVAHSVVIAKPFWPAQIIVAMSLLLNSTGA